MENFCKSIKILAFCTPFTYNKCTMAQNFYEKSMVSPAEKHMAKRQKICPPLRTMGQPDVFTTE